MKIIIIFIYNTHTFLVYDTFVNTSVSNKNQKAYRLENIKLNRAEGMCLGCVLEAHSPYSLWGCGDRIPALGTREEVGH